MVFYAKDNICMGREIIQWQSPNIDPTSQRHDTPIATILRSLDYVPRQYLRHFWALQTASLAPLERILTAEMQPPDPDLAQLLPAEFAKLIIWSLGDGAGLIL